MQLGSHVHRVVPCGAGTEHPYTPFPLNSVGGAHPGERLEGAAPGARALHRHILPLPSQRGKHMFGSRLAL